MRIRVDDGQEGQKPIGARVGAFDDDAVVHLQDQIRAAQDAEQPLIIVEINSDGGDVYSLMAMVDLFESAKRTMAVSTYCSAKAFSCGAFLLACGSQGYRFAGPSSTVMIHKPFGGVAGGPDDFKVETKEIARLHKKVFKMLGEHSGKGAQFFLDKIANNTDWYLTATEARRAGIVDKIHVPSHVISTEVHHKIV